MSLYERLGLGLLRRVDAERAHGLALKALRHGLVPMPPQVQSPRLRVQLAGLDLPNPVGLAAGFDKNAVALRPLCRAGFGFLEVGAVTHLPQPGNPRPRLFRLSEDRAVINRFGFNNDGAKAVAARLAQRPRDCVIGVNLGANKDARDRMGNFVAALRVLGPLSDFATVNVSSPNTPGLRDLQDAHALSELLAKLMRARDEMNVPLPIFLKIAPDLRNDELAAIAEIAAEAEVNAVIATNTTTARENLRSPQAGQAGGLSGAPLFERATRSLARMSQLLEGRIPLIGVGGVGSAEDAYAKIRAGATAVQLYSALVYEGLSLVSAINRGLDALLERDGFASVADAVGTGRADWL